MRSDPRAEQRQKESMSVRRGFSIQWKLVVAFLAAGLLPMLISAWLAAGIMKANIKASKKDFFFIAFKILNIQ